VYRRYPEAHPGRCSRCPWYEYRMGGPVNSTKTAVLLAGSESRRTARPLGPWYSASEPVSWSVTEAV
jgi:hypothetical protein